ncbi:MAG: GTPase Era [Mariprofundales bacterium]|nr:GTPase Era [Mariprofundales bacterium]
MDEQTEFRCGYVALLGKPNVGKSTLLNRIIGSRIAIVTPKPQTTRTRILGIYTDRVQQLIFIDTPGIHRSSRRMNRNMVKVAMAAAGEADVLLLVHDVTRPIDGEMEQLIATISTSYGERPRLHILNKIDRIAADDLLPKLAELHALDSGAAAFVPVSARKGIEVAGLLKILTPLLPKQPPLHDPEWFTDQSSRTLAAEYVREQLFIAMQQEIPFQTAVVVEQFHEHGRAIDVEAVILVGSRSHKPMVIGRGGARLKQIGRAARLGLQELLDRRVDLRLFVKVQPNWFERSSTLRELGLE